MGAQLFLLFPEYSDKSASTCFFLETTYLRDDEEMADYLRLLKIMVSYLRWEDLEFYFDPGNLDAFAKPFDVLQDEYPNKKRFLMELVHNHMSNWRGSSVIEPTDRFEYLQREIKDNSLCEVAKRKSIAGDVLYIVVNHDALNTVKNDVEELEVSVDGANMTFPAIRLDVGLLLDWLVTNNVAKRHYLPNTDKHGNGGQGGSEAEDASKLLCSDEKAKGMMFKAVKVKKHLYYFDAEEQLYIKFMSGNNDTFHPYHITSAQDEHKNVPDEAKKALRLHLGKFKTKFE